MSALYRVELALVITFSRHRHLIKFMSLVLPNGYILDTIGPFVGTMNDASIAKAITNTCSDLMQWCQEGDTMIVDRGFRDVIDVFVELGFEPKMPSFLTKGKRQHDAQEANRSRLITKVRWRVESYHARLKKWLLIGGRVENAFVPKISDCIRILSAALNCYRGPIGTDHLNEDDSALAQQMRSMVNRNNALFDRVMIGSLSSRVRWQRIEDVSFDFPALSIEEMRELFFGTYQMKMARAYVEEHMDDDGAYVIEIDNTETNILRANIQSRHSNARKYKVWIQYSFSADPIQAWYCQCTSGARNLGCCGHVASIIWYLSYARHDQFNPSPGRRRLLQAIEQRPVDTSDDSSAEDTEEED